MCIVVFLQGNYYFKNFELKTFTPNCLLQTYHFITLLPHANQILLKVTVSHTCMQSSAALFAFPSLVDKPLPPAPPPTPAEPEEEEGEEVEPWAGPGSCEAEDQ